MRFVLTIVVLAYGFSRLVNFEDISNFKGGFPVLARTNSQLVVSTRKFAESILALVAGS